MARLNTRLTRLESIRAAREPRLFELPLEHQACVQRLVDRFYADPLRYASQIRLMDCIRTGQCTEWYNDG